jgi:peptidoglycan hydrolase-like protein with peptidoglycan-binding domain
MPAVAIKKGQKGNGVKWLQWELREAGYDLDIDGSFGNITYRVVKLFQKSCKLDVDGVCGPDTKKALLIN